MAKIHIHTFKLRNALVNLCIVLLLGIITVVTFLGGSEEVSTIPAGVYYNGNKESDKVSLMINVYWGTEYMKDILEVLDEKDVKVTFFVGGSWVLNNVELLRTISQKGHEIANHGYKHKDQDKLSREESKKEMKTTHDIVKDAIGIDMTLFAPPSGAYNNQTVQVAEEMGYKTIMWTRDTIDWRDHNTELIYSRAIKDVKGGDLILMHPTQNTLEALPSIIDYIKDKNLEIVTVSECI